MNFSSVLLKSRGISTLLRDKLYLTKPEINKRTLKYSIPVASGVVSSRGTVRRENKNHQKKESQINAFSYKARQAAAAVSGLSPKP